MVLLLNDLINFLIKSAHLYMRICGTYIEAITIWDFRYAFMRRSVNLKFSIEHSHTNLITIRNMDVSWFSSWSKANLRSLPVIIHVMTRQLLFLVTQL